MWKSGEKSIKFGEKIGNKIIKMWKWAKKGGNPVCRRDIFVLQMQCTKNWMDKNQGYEKPSEFRIF